VHFFFLEFFTRLLPRDSSSSLHLLRTLFAHFCNLAEFNSFFSSDSLLFAQNTGRWGVLVNPNQTISAARLFQLQSAGSLWLAANPHAL